ncbi:hypothetical protein JI435_400710 [Parastagonospora nodorum SN15]|uniref:Uncharacterized protein n=1 Tax=Phaeosphaeria nodorum (strain SN15 / ATCC MYA-4574 / FGSC 10173) TaxID=321614 RepID=A0A7U2HU73_PHANO|nr:hypothetical protein JI435_400710 [Parastagonospora nodorum SN15]
MRYTLGRTGVMPSSSCSSCLRPDTHRGCRIQHSQNTRPLSWQ